MIKKQISIQIKYNKILAPKPVINLICFLSVEYPLTLHNKYIANGINIDDIINDKENGIILYFNNNSSSSPPNTHKPNGLNADIICSKIDDVTIDIVIIHIV